MKRTPLRRGTKPLKRSALKRKSKLKARGKSRFPERRRPKYLAWIRRQECTLQQFPGIGHVCSFWPERLGIEPAHIKTQGSGGDDYWNTVPLCPAAHDKQEGKTRYFESIYDVDLTALAALYTQQYHDETGESIL